MVDDMNKADKSITTIVKNGFIHLSDHGEKTETRKHIAIYEA